MSITKQTRCPHCSSVFNITDEQLAARGGHVRCGGCLQVFRADQHLLSESIVINPPTPEPAPNLGSMPVVAHTQSAMAAPTASAPKRKKPEDDSWAFNLLGDDADSTDIAEETPPAPTAKAEPTASASSAKKPLFDDEISDLLHEAWSEPIEKNHLKGVGEVDKLKASADESWAQALMSELEEEEKKEQAKGYGMELQPQKPKEPSRKPASTPADAPSPNTNRSAPAKASNNTKDNVDTAKDDDLLSFLNSNSAPVITQRNTSLPVEIRTSHMVSINWSYWLTWTLLCGIALILLMAQYIYFQFEQLSQAERTRPQMVQLCNVLGCAVPEPPDIRLIAINKLVVRAHPDVKEALRVNAIVYNKAHFAQPLPALNLMFLGKKDKVLAARAFQPKEYLQGEATNLRRIPPETPIHIQLDIVKPKADLATYKMQPLY